MNLSPEQSAWLSQTRAEWYKVMRPFDGFGARKTFAHSQKLLTSHLDDARLFATREEMLLRFAKVNGVLCEVGTQEGYLAQFIFDHVSPRELVVLDIDTSLIKKIHPQLAQAPNVAIIEGDSSTILRSYPDQHFDLIYIDGDHSYEGVKKDLDAALDKIKTDGLIICNDYVLWSVLEMQPYGVVYAVNELCAAGRLKVKGLALHTMMYCDIALCRT